MFRGALVFSLVIAGCEARGACDAPGAGTCADGVPRSACASEAARERQRFSPGRTCADLGYASASGGFARSPAAAHRNDVLGFAVVAPPGATFVSGTGTEIVRWVVPAADGPFPILCAIEIGAADAGVFGLDEARQELERSGVFAIAESSAVDGGVELVGAKRTDPGLAKVVTRRRTATRSGEISCTGPRDRLGELRAVVRSFAVD